MFKKKEVDYFELFIEQAKITLKAAEKLEAMLNASSTEFSQRMQDIHEVEREGDVMYHKLYKELNLSFITPIEREDILEISRNIEQATDAIDEVSIMIDLLSVTSVRPVAKELVNLIIKASTVMLDAVKEFKNFKKSTKLNGDLVEINHIEEDGDKLYQDAIRELFAKEANVLEVIKWKNILDTLEAVLDTCENVADGIEAVIVKNS